jgi:hypothetical protein
MSDTNEAPFDMHKLLVEIDDEVRAKRASGELPADLERELDLVFARFAPAGALDGDFDQLMERAEQQAFFDLLAPNESARKGVPQIKRVVQKTVRWYLRYVVDQITGFSHTMTKAVRQLGDRVERVEQLSASPDELDAAIARLGAGDEQLAWHAPLIEAFKKTNGRVLHARCGSGSLVAELKQAGVDAYGVDHAATPGGTAVDNGLDLRPDDELTHLSNLAAGLLSGLILTGSVDVLPRGAQIELIDLAAVVLDRGGRLALVVSDPKSWDVNHSPVEVDLAPGRPMHIETWRHLLEDRGFNDIVIEHGSSHGGLTHVPGTSETAAGMNANIDQLNSLLFPPASHLILAVR